MSLEDEAKQAAICKLHLDLWIHQNTLMWSRLQTLGFMQAGFLALAYALWRDTALNKYASWACLICILATFGLGIVMWTDRRLRNIHRVAIELFDLNLYPASTTQKKLSDDSGTKVNEPVFHFFIFIIFIILDILAANLFGLPMP